jgi:hypothetical protein
MYQYIYNNSILYLFTCSRNSPKANYKISTSKDGIKRARAQKQRQTKAAWTKIKIQ